MRKVGRSFLSLGFASCLVIATSATLPLGAGAIDMPQIVSHRGESQERPENTMASFRLAFAREVDGVECDVYATTDGVPVIIHDSSTGRTAGAGTNLTVTSSSWNDLKDVRVGAFGKWIGTEWEGETLPKFEDYLALLASNNTTRCIVELKGNGANNLIANVVAAIQAQPLATKDRVTFIAFDANLISAIRQALPDYEAWLLLGNGTYTGADIVSSLADCNATGVDIYHAATYSAEDVAAVKAAGYAFAVWTPNSDADALKYAQMGVDAITTDRGGAMKANLAVALTAWNEIYDSSLPDGVTYLDVGAYVTNGLVAHFDGIRNAGMSRAHDPLATTWKNLVEGGTTATRTTLSSSVPSHAAAGYWTNNAAYHLGGKEYFALDDAIVFGKKLTVELATDFVPTAQLYNQGDTGVQWPMLFGSVANDQDDLSLYPNMSSGSGGGTWIYFKVNRGTTRCARGWDGRYANAIYDGDNARLSVTNGTTPVWQASSKNGAVSANATAFAIGTAGNTDGFKAKRMFVGDVYSVRVYNRILTDEEQAWNRWLDDMRFRTGDSVINVIVESNVAGAEGVEANGQYLVNGHHTFSAAATAVAGNEWEPTGYKLETWTAEKGKWDLVGEYDGASFAYTNCAARAKVRLTWNWRLVNGVKKYDADSYVQAGLVLNFDGIRNAGLDQPHDPSATTWKNLVPGPDAARAVVVAGRPGAWTSDGYDFAAGDCFVTDAAVALTNQVTVQLVADYDATAQTNNWPSPFGASYNSDVFGLYTYTPYTGSGNDRRGDRLMFRADPVNGASRALQPWNGRIANSIVDYNRASHTGDASQSWWNGTFKAPPASYRYCIGTAWSSAEQRTKRMFKGRIHAIRIYDRVLTAAELRRNKEIDYVRFYGTAGLSTETDLVEVRSEVPGIDLEDIGGWIVRGTGAKTFTAPATVTVDNRTYACAGYRLETWNATKRMWENPIISAELSTAVIGTTGQPNRRITWLWTLTAGVRAAADYDVGDYVQQGLVAHYDGIHNSGARNAHSTRSIFWRDLSYRDDPMKAASNTAYAAWIEKGHRFTAAEKSSFRMEEDISLGTECTIQAAMDVDCSTQTTDFPLYFGFGNGDFSMFTRGTGTTLEIKTDGWVSSSTARLKLSKWGGKYLTNIITPTDHYLIQGTERAGGAGRARENFIEMPSKKMLIGAATTYGGSDLAKRCMTGDYYALRIYNRALTDAELAQNRKVDEIRYRDNFANYRNLVVVNEQPEGAGETVQGSVADGEYELTGAWTFTAAPVAVDGVTLKPKYKIETLVNGEWVKTASDWGHSCTITAGNVPVRLTWQWQKPSGLVLRVQ